MSPFGSRSGDDLVWPGAGTELSCQKQCDHEPEKHIESGVDQERDPEPGTGVTASAVRIRPWMIQGWRPTSVTVQPASMASIPRGLISMVALRNMDPSGTRLLRQATAAAQNETNAIARPQATIT